MTSRTIHFSDATGDVPIRGNSHSLLVLYFTPGDASYAQDVAAKLQTTYPAFLVNVQLSPQNSLSCLEFYFVPAGGRRQRLSSNLLVNGSGWDVTPVVREFDRLLAKHPPPNLFVRVVSAELDDDVASELCVKLQLGQQEHATPARPNTLCTTWPAESATFGFFVNNPVTDTLTATLWCSARTDIDAQQGRVDILLDQLTVNRTKQALGTMIGVQGKLRLLLRATAPPFPRQPRQNEGHMSYQSASLPTLQQSTTADRAMRSVLSTASLPPFLDVGASGLNMTDEAMRELFDYMDKGGSGYVTKEEFKTLYAAFETFGCDDDDHYIDRLLKNYNMLGDDVLSFDEFALLILKIAQR